MYRRAVAALFTDRLCRPTWSAEDLLATLEGGIDTVERTRTRSVVVVKNG